jgi:hypothetical protein
MGNSKVGAQLAASQEGLSYLELDSHTKTALFDNTDLLIFMHKYYFTLFVQVVWSIPYL